MRLGRKLPELIVSIIVIYTVMPFLAPVAFKLGLPEVGQAIHQVYSFLCHQRVERSVFLFGSNGPINLYTLEELQAMGEVPLYNINAPLPQYADSWFGYPFWGNEVIGYKIAICVRDIGLYLGLAITAIYSYVRVKAKKMPKLRWWVIALLIAPMVVDGLFQSYLELIDSSWLPASFVDGYIANNLKRVVTGFLFGAGFGLGLIPYMMDVTRRDFGGEEREKVVSNKS